ncbi:MAG: hypothetical protein RIB93_06130 [Coleofasciculus sp. D1-CHI-01]|uniref:hypothetical protein n=1 Tax=Coleofasciculus sp. D1-CHI-01 TaxID=3068482 RepID=UPI0032F1955B
MKNLSNVETDESDDECDRTPPATRHLHPTRGYVILNAAKRSEESPPMLKLILSLNQIRDTLQTPALYQIRGTLPPL